MATIDGLIARIKHLEAFVTHICEDLRVPADLHDRAAKILDRPSLAHGAAEDRDARLAKIGRHRLSYPPEPALLERLAARKSLFYKLGKCYGCQTVLVERVDLDTTEPPHMLCDACHERRDQLLKGTARA